MTATFDGDEYITWLEKEDGFYSRTDEECPFCAGEIEYDGHVFYCARCEVEWRNGDELAADRANADALDEYIHRTP